MTLLRSLFRFALASAFGLALAGPALAGGGDLPIKTKRIINGLAYPTRVVFAPGDDTHMYIAEKNGLIRIFDLSTSTLQATPFLNIVSLVQGGASVNDEQGLLGLAFHPDWPNTPYFYVYYTSIAGGGDDTVRRYTALSATQADVALGDPVWSWDDPFGNHNGGWIEFGPDGYLYIGSGDGGSANDPGNRSQDITSQPLGKMHRIDINGDDFRADANKNYAIVPTNPFVGITGDDEILHFGLRNPWSCSFDRLTGDLYIGDVGQDAWEEIDIAYAGQVGLNFGWRCMEGNACTGLTGCTCNGVALTDPVHVYNHGSGFSTTGGVVYRGCAIPEAQGTYFFGDYGSGSFWSFKMVDGVKTEFTLQTSKFTPSLDGFTLNQEVSFAQDHQGEIYIVDHGSASTGQIFKLVRNPASPNLPDCDGDGQPDACDLAGGAADCDNNGIPDACDITGGVEDCNGNGAIDECEIDAGQAEDCNGDGSIDSCQIASGTAPDCNGDGAIDSCQIASGELADVNGNGIPDVCEPPALPEDLNGDGIVDAADLAMVLGAWGRCPAPCAADFNNDGVVDAADLATLLGAWSA